MQSKLIVENHSDIHIEYKLEQILTCLKKLHNHHTIELVSIICEDIGYKTPNFTTSGIYRLHGIINLDGENTPSCIILKIIKPDSDEKDDHQHHNYWRREAHVFESGILQDLPDSIRAANHLLIEEQQDEVWIWMEYVEGEHATTIEQFSYIARQLGRFNGTYLVEDQRLPEHEWVCRAWLKSWTTASRMYAPNVEEYANQVTDENLQRIWTWYQKLIENIEPLLDSLQLLPRVLAHQDLSQMNMFLVQDESSETHLVLIDWQFMSISGIGEDLGKLFGVNISLGFIPPSQYQIFQEALFHSYIKGLQDKGWQGDVRLAQYGYYLSTALRSVWEVPKLFALHAKLIEEPNNHELQDSFDQLYRIIHIHKKMSEEAESLKSILYARSAST